MNSISDDERNLLDDIEREEEEAWAIGRGAVQEAEQAAEERRAEPYPPESLTPAPIDPAPEPEDDSGFALPSETQTRTEASSSGGDQMDAQEATKDPYESHPPQRIQMAELQKCMLRSKLIIMHTFENDKTGAGDSVLAVLKAEKPEVYADIVVRCAMALYIGWQKGMGLH